jgi:hypothetical protein
VKVKKELEGVRGGQRERGRRCETGGREYENDKGDIG